VCTSYRPTPATLVRQGTLHCPFPPSSRRTVYCYSYGGLLCLSVCLSLSVHLSVSHSCIPRRFPYTNASIQELKTPLHGATGMKLSSSRSPIPHPPAPGPSVLSLHDSVPYSGQHGTRPAVLVRRRRRPVPRPDWPGCAPPLLFSTPSVPASTDEGSGLHQVHPSTLYIPAPTPSQTASSTPSSVPVHPRSSTVALHCAVSYVLLLPYTSWTLLLTLCPALANACPPTTPTKVSRSSAVA